MNFSHIKDNKLNMVDVSQKRVSKREAIAQCNIIFSKSSLNKLLKNGSPKGEIFNTAKCAGIIATKKTSELIPLCHNINLTFIGIDIIINKKENLIVINSIVKTDNRTGVEIEALTGCSVAALTIFDMCKSIDKSIEIKNLKLVKKTGGKSGPYTND
tara:strand:+ start:605 stop:1075 length:471 start_codon:yes stop_codon:yes gene_type:complete